MRRSETSLMGELEKNSGSISMHGRLCYVPQQPWMHNNALRQSITFGKQFFHSLSADDEDDTSVPGGIMIEGDSGFEYDDDVMTSPIIDHVLGTSHMSTVSGIINRRRSSTSTQKHRHRLSTNKSTAPSIVSVDTTSRQVTGTERIETGRVKMDTYQKYFGAIGMSIAVIFVFGMMVRSLWLTDWSNDNAARADSLGFSQKTLENDVANNVADIKRFKEDNEFEKMLTAENCIPDAMTPANVVSSSSMEDSMDGGLYGCLYGWMV
ncbi:unnamed protein product [Caenorhabditis sp. 36 PRJEB53466]|nr:unnamed protein product [Caenorhabditis sp. 36 PRJEB53466]